MLNEKQSLSRERSFRMVESTSALLSSAGRDAHFRMRTVAYSVAVKPSGNADSKRSFVDSAKRFTSERMRVGEFVETDSPTPSS